MTAAVQAGLTPQRGQSDRSFLKVRWNLPAFLPLLRAQNPPHLMSPTLTLLPLDPRLLGMMIGAPMMMIYFSASNTMNDYDYVPAGNMWLAKCNDHFLKYKHAGLTSWRFNAQLLLIQLLRLEDLLLNPWMFPSSHLNSPDSSDIKTSCQRSHDSVHHNPRLARFDTFLTGIPYRPFWLFFPPLN